MCIFGRKVIRTVPVFKDGVRVGVMYIYGPRKFRAFHVL